MQQLVRRQTAGPVARQAPPRQNWLRLRPHGLRSRSRRRAGGPCADTGRRVGERRARRHEPAAAQHWPERRGLLGRGPWEPRRARRQRGRPVRPADARHQRARRQRGRRVRPARARHQRARRGRRRRPAALPRLLHPPPPRLPGRRVRGGGRAGRRRRRRARGAAGGPPVLAVLVRVAAVGRRRARRRRPHAARQGARSALSPARSRSRRDASATPSAGSGCWRSRAVRVSLCPRALRAPALHG